MLSGLEKILFIAAVALAAGLAFNELRRKYGLIASGQKVSRWDRPLQRLWEMFYRVFLQLPVFAQRPVTGFFHAVIFWGFLVFLGVTLNHVAEGFFAGFSLFGHGALYSLLLFAANLFAGLIIAAVLYFFVRRYVVRVKSLVRPSWQSLTVLFFIFTLMVSFVFYEAFKNYDFLAASVPGQDFSPIGFSPISSSTAVPASLRCPPFSSG